MMKTSVFLLSSAAAFVLTAAPVVREQSVTIARVGQSSTWCISYVLDNDPGVVTLDVLTNGVTIGAANFANVKGDVGHLVQPGPRTIMWKAHKSWPGHKVSDLSVRVTAWAANCPPPYLVLSLDSATPPVYYADTNSIPNWGENENRLFKTEKLVLKRIPAAGRCWRMGAGLGDPGALHPHGHRRQFHRGAGLGKLQNPPFRTKLLQIITYLFNSHFSPPSSRRN